MLVEKVWNEPVTQNSRYRVGPADHTVLQSLEDGSKASSRYMYQRQLAVPNVILV
jgi:hypothetical protein